MEKRTKICDEDCFNCPYPDCINDGMTAGIYQSLDEIEKELLFPRSAQEKKRAAYQRKYREANRDKIAAQQREYREANREKIAAQQREKRRARHAGE